MRQISDWPARQLARQDRARKARREGDVAALSALYSVMNRLPPLIARLRPANSPPPVLVSMAMPSLIQAMAWVWL